jgi:translation initiation factor 2B subunit (eIF-2B alpha/beta/delta family)
MQEQQEVINQQQQQIDALKNELAEIKQAVSKLANNQNINTYLSSAQLSEVIPNPVKGSASIQYSVPEGSRRAQLLITDALGRSIRQVSLSTSGVVNIDVSALANGIYNYSLIVDNKTMVTKKMTVVR